MKNTLDTALSNHIKNSFENYNPKFKPEYWENFAKKRNSKTRKITWFWPTIAKAASVAIFITATPYYVNKTTENITSKFLVNSTVEKSEIKKPSDLNIHYNQVQQIELGSIVINSNLPHNTIAQLPTRIASIQNLEKNKFQEKKFVNKNETKEIVLTALSPDFIEKKSSKKNKKINFGLNLTSAAGSQNNQSNTLYGGAFVANLKLSKNIDFSSGIAWQKNNQIEQQSYEFATADINTVNTTEKTNYNVVSIPLGFRLRLKKHLGFKISSSLDYLGNIEESKTANVKTKTYLAKTNNSELKDYNSAISNSLSTTSKINQLQALSNMRFTFSYKLKKDNLNINLEPFMQIPLGKKTYNSVSLIGLNIKYDLNLG